MAYELAPNAAAYGGRIAINAAGSRGREPLPNDTPGLRRIAVVGDSMTFGFGVLGEQAYPQVLEASLVAAGLASGERWEVLNLGVSGYSAADNAIVLATRALASRPELIIVGYCLNDPELEPIQPLHAYFAQPVWWQRSHLTRLLALGAHRAELLYRGRGDYYVARHARGSPSWQSVLRAFADMAQAAGEVPVLVVIFPDSRVARWADYPYRSLHDQVAQAAADAGLEALDLFAAFAKHPPERLRVAPGDPHPSPFGHQVIAAAILERL